MSTKNETFADVIKAKQIVDQNNNAIDVMWNALTAIAAMDPIGSGVEMHLAANSAILDVISIIRAVAAPVPGGPVSGPRLPVGSMRIVDDDSPAASGMTFAAAAAG